MAKKLPQKYSELRKLSVADMSETIRQYLRKLGGNKFEDLCEVSSTNGYWFIWFPYSRDLKKNKIRFSYRTNEWLLDWEGEPMRRYHLAAFFARINNPENYEGE